MNPIKYLVICSLKYLRIRKTLKHIKNGVNILDIGCGDCALLNKIKNRIKCGVGIDERIKPQKNNNIELKKLSIKTGLPFEKSTFDVITMTAFIEHLDNPYKLLNDVNRVLKKNGLIIITTPTPKSRPIWEFLVNLGFSDEESDEEGVNAHKHYFNLNELSTILKETGFKIVESKLFEFGMNSFIVGEKL